MVLRYEWRVYGHGNWNRFKPGLWLSLSKTFTLYILAKPLRNVRAGELWNIVLLHNSSGLNAWIDGRMFSFWFFCRGQNLCNGASTLQKVQLLSPHSRRIFWGYFGFWSYCWETSSMSSCCNLGSHLFLTLFWSEEAFQSFSPISCCNSSYM